ncbi:MAG: hypothetical protein VX438_03820 [Planctomycetota bacterium]|jgi:hypothetical protein|nr:hypothetical protein [Planctomycetota bacterium]
MPRITFENYPVATVACFDATTGPLPRRLLDPSTNNLFLETLAQQGAAAVLIGASTGQGHVRTAEELNQWFLSIQGANLGDTIKIALLRPEDGPSWHQKHVETLVEAGFEVAFVRPGTNLGSDASDSQVADNMHSACQCIADADLTLGVYSIPDVSGIALRPDAVAEIQQGFGDHLVAVKVTESNYQQSTKRFLSDQRLRHLKIVQGWDPFLADALQDDPIRCGITSGPMSFALLQYLHLLEAAQRKDWAEVYAAQAAVTQVFQSMQDDPTKFADLQRAKCIMGLGHPLLSEILPAQMERVFHALETLSRDQDKQRIAASLNLLQKGPYASRLSTL